MVSVLERMRATGARTVAIVNATASPLGDAADVVIDLDAGGELAVPATKTFTATLVALALVAAAMGPVPWSDADLDAAAGGVAEVLDDPTALARSRGGSTAPTACSPWRAGRCSPPPARPR